MEHEVLYHDRKLPIAVHSDCSGVNSSDFWWFLLIHNKQEDFSGPKELQNRAYITVLEITPTKYTRIKHAFRNKYEIGIWPEKSPQIAANTLASTTK
jgi:hypothetical protein